MKDESTVRLCHQDKTVIRAARGNILLNVIKNYYVQRGEYGVTNVLAKLSGSNVDWSWTSQSDWSGSCKSKNQSPIDIVQANSVETANMRIYLNYKANSVANAKFNGHEIVVSGEFGQLIHQLEVGERRFSAKEIRFKFPSEHSLDGTQLDGEMVVRHTSSNGNEAFVSIFLKEVSDGEAEHNIFVEALDPLSWTFDSGKSARCDGRPDIAKIVKGNIQVNYPKSFYWYQGSITEPPCTTPVFRYVMKKAVEIGTTQFQSLKSHSFNAAEEASGNIRSVQNAVGRMIYSHSDQAVNCQLQSTKIMEGASYEVAKVAATKAKEWGGKWIKAEQKLNSYAVKIYLNRLLMVQLILFLFQTSVSS